ncbi:MAG: hypothetical protein ACE5G1_00705 [bacterium]
MRLFTKHARNFIWLGIIFTLLSPNLVLSCPFCFSSSTEEVLHSYYFSVIMLSLMPFGIIGMIAFVLYANKRSLQRNRNSDQEV